MKRGTITREFVDRGKPVFGICHATQLLITAQLLKGWCANGWTSIIQEINNTGAEYVEADVVVDNDLITSINLMISLGFPRQRWRCRKTGNDFFLEGYRSDINPFNNSPIFLPDYHI